MMRFPHTYLLLVFSFIVTYSLGQESSATLSFDREEIKIGEQIEMKIELSFPVTETFSFASLKDTLSKSIEIVEFNKIDTTFTGSNLSTKVLTGTLTITSFDTGYHTIAPILFRGSSGEIKSNAALIHVIDVEVEMPAQSAQGEPEIEIKDIKDIRERDFSIWEWIKQNYLWILLFILLAAAAWYYIVYIHPKLKDKGISTIVAKKTVPPYIIALEKLKSLEDTKLWQQGKVKEYHSNLSEIIREYIEFQLDIPALESTTGEIMEALKNQPIEGSVQHELFEVLQLADLVKFAKYIPLGDQNDTSIKVAYHFVDVSKPVEEVENKEQQDIVLKDV